MPQKVTSGEKESSTVSAGNLNIMFNCFFSWFHQFIPAAWLNTLKQVFSEAAKISLQTPWSHELHQVMRVDADRSYAFL